MRRSSKPRPSVSLTAILAIGLTATAVPDAFEGQVSAQQATQSVTATATFGPWTSLQVSTQVLRFHVTDASTPAEVQVDFAAGARTRNGGEVVLLVQVMDPERLRRETGDHALTIAAGTEGTIAGPVAHAAPATAARWIGGGLRTGRVTFRLQAAPGQYEIPVRFLLNLS